MELEHLSYSSISAYLSCGRAWRYKYIEKETTYPTPELVYGSAIHGAIESWLGSERHDGPVSHWQAAWNKACEQQVAWGADNPEQYYNDGVKMLSNDAIKAGLRTICPGQDEDGLQIERKVILRVPGVPVPIVGYIDIQTADGIPGDFKTSSKSWSQDRAQNETQSLFYLAALWAGRTVPGWKFRHYVFVKTKTPQFQMFEHRHTPTEVFWLFGMIRNVWLGIEREVYPENPGSWKCSAAYCDFWMKCRGKS